MLLGYDGHSTVHDDCPTSCDCNWNWNFLCMGCNNVDLDFSDAELRYHQSVRCRSVYSLV